MPEISSSMKSSMVLKISIERVLAESVLTAIEKVSNVFSSHNLAAQFVKLVVT